MLRYGQVLVTNYREFVLMVRTRDGNAKRADAFSLAPAPDAFWRLAAEPRKTAAERGPRLVEFLTRVLRNRAVLTEPEDVAWFLASHARDAMDAVGHHDLPTLDAVRAAFEEALGIRFEGEKGDHFFRSSLVQTLFYGSFSGWVLWSREHPPTDQTPFDWQKASWHLKVPMINALFAQIAQPGPIEELGMKAILDRTGEVLNRVDRAAFFSRFQDAEAVQYFYEPFLEAFDPELRKELGVWYTPREVVKYMVARVNTVLKEELGIARGLVYWANVPRAVWEYTLGGYQVIKKWLSYREKDLLGRDLTADEARYVTEMVRRISAILSLGPELDASYERAKRHAYPWPVSGAIP